jgi:hypothetical protein
MSRADKGIAIELLEVLYLADTLVIFFQTIACFEVWVPRTIFNSMAYLSAA